MSPLKPNLRRALGAAAIALAAAWVYWPAIHGGWVWDDFAEIVRNPVLRDPAGIRRIWLAPAAADYFPLKTTAQWLEWRQWGANPLGYHAVDVVLHVICALLFWRLLGRLGVRAAWLGGLLFTVHPLCVESVAWVAEFKNILSLLFLLLASLAWTERDKSPQEDREEREESPDALASSRPSRSSGVKLSFLFFSLAMLSKSTVVMFPVVLLLYAWWRGGRIGRRDLAATAPFFLVSLALGLVTVVFQERRAIGGVDLATGGLLARCAGAGRAVLFYLAKAVFPAHLLPNYPLWHLNPPRPADFLPWAALAALGLAAYFYRHGSSPRARDVSRGALFGLGFFALNLLPVIGLVPMSYLRISWVADHFVYLPLLGLVGLAAAGVGTLLPQEDREGREGKTSALLPVLPDLPVKMVLTVTLSALVVVVLAVASHRYARVFTSDEALWSYTLARNPDSWTAQNDLGMSLADRGRPYEAIGHYEAALRLRPDFAAAHINWGNALAAEGSFAEAQAQYESALRLKPDSVEAGTDLGNALAQSGQFRAAVEAYEAVLKRDPEFAGGRANLAYAHWIWGNALGNGGRIPEAIAQYEEALRWRPDYAEARADLGLALANAGRTDEAIGELQAAVRLNPRYPEAEADLGFALAAAGRAADAIAAYRRALELRPGDADVHYHLGLALRQAGRYAEAGAELAEAERLQAAAPRP